MKNKALKVKIEAQIEGLNNHSRNTEFELDEDILFGIEQMTGMDMDRHMGINSRHAYLKCCGSRNGYDNNFISREEAIEAKIPVWGKSKVKVCPQCAILARTDLDSETKQLIVKYRKAYINWSKNNHWRNQRELDEQQAIQNHIDKVEALESIESLGSFEEKSAFFVRTLMSRVSGIHSNSGDEIKFTGHESLTQILWSHILQSEGIDDWGRRIDPDAGWKASPLCEDFKRDELTNWLKPWLPSYIGDFDENIQHMEHAKNEIVKMYMLDTDDPITLAHDWCEHEFWDYTYPTSECAYDAVMITVDSTDGPVQVCSNCGDAEKCGGEE